MTRLFVSFVMLASCMTPSQPPRTAVAVVPRPSYVDASIVSTPTDFFTDDEGRRGGGVLDTDVSLGTLPVTVRVSTSFVEAGAHLASRVSYLVRRDGEQVATVPADRESDTYDARAIVTLDRIGTYTAELLVDDKPLGVAPARLAVAVLPCFGGKRVLRAREVGVSVDKYAVHIRRWHALDEASPYLIEWRRDGALVKSEAAYPENWWRLYADVEQFQMTGQGAAPTLMRRAHSVDPRCAWDMVREEYEAPVPADYRGPMATIVSAQGVERVAPVNRVPLAAGSWTVRVVVRGEAPLEISFSVDKAHEISDTVVRPTTVSKGDEIKLRRAKKSPYKHHTVLPVTAAELRALTRSVAAVRLREQVNELSIPIRSSLEESDIRRRRDLSPEQKFQLIRKYNRELEQDDARETARKQAQGRREAKKLVQLIEKFGGPWTNDERPTNHPSMFY